MQAFSACFMKFCLALNSYKKEITEVRRCVIAHRRIFCRKKGKREKKTVFPGRESCIISRMQQSGSERSALIGRASGRNLPDFMQEERGQYEKVKKLYLHQIHMDIYFL